MDVEIASSPELTLRLGGAEMLLEILKLVAQYLLALYIPFLMILSLLYKKPKRAKEKVKNVVFVIVTIGSSKVRDALMDTIQNVKRRFSEYLIYVLTEEDAELLGELRSIPGINVITVPSNYRCRARHKARALNYFVQNFVREDYWYVFLDDDSYPLDDNFLYEIPEFEKQGLLLGNGILVPRRGRSLISFLADFARTTVDKVALRFTLGILHKPYLFGFHGELMIVRGDVLKEIGFDFDTISEDSRFAAEAYRRGIRLFQTTSRVSILSPNSVRDLWKQRGRWFKGVLRDFINYPPIMREITAVVLLLWATAIFGYFWVIGSLFTTTYPIIKLLVLGSPPEFEVTLNPLVYELVKFLLSPGFLGVVCGLSIYLIGSQRGYRLLAVLLAPILFFIELLGPWYGLFFISNDRFIVVDKSYGGSGNSK